MLDGCFEVKYVPVRKKRALHAAQIYWLCFRLYCSCSPCTAKVVEGGKYATEYIQILFYSSWAISKKCKRI